MITNNWKTWTKIEVSVNDFISVRQFCRDNLGQRGIEAGWRWGTTSFPGGPFHFYFKDPAVATFVKISV